MAIAYSTQYNALHVAGPGNRQDAQSIFGHLMILPFDFVNPGTGGLSTLGDQVYLVKVPASCDIIVPLTYLSSTAWAASTVVDIGHAAYKNVSGATVAAAEAALINDITVAAIGTWHGNMSVTGASTLANNFSVTGVFQVRAQSGVILTATFRGAAPTASDELHGFFVIAVP